MTASPQGERLAQGYVHVYTGKGKGKTTAALGLALRAAGAGLRVWIGQFVKGMEYSEITALRRYDDLISVQQFGRGCFIHRDPEPADIECAKQGLDTAREVLTQGEHDLMILDEVHIATNLKLVPVADVCALIDSKPAHVELILTGRYADPAVLDKADLITEMCEVKHYYHAGVSARTGIER